LQFLQQSKDEIGKAVDGLIELIKEDGIWIEPIKM